MSRIRKAVAAFIAPFLALNITQMIVDGFDWAALSGAAGVGLLAAVAVYFTPNQPPDPAA